MRFLFGLLLLIGIALGAAPWLLGALPDQLVGTWRVYEAATGFAPAEVRLAAADAPLGVAVDLTVTGLVDLPKSGAILTMTAAMDGNTVLARALDFAGVPGRDINPQTGEKIFRAVAGVIDPIEPGNYTFTFTNGDAEGVTVRAVDLTLSRHAVSVDRRLQPIGFSLAAIGFIGFILAFRHGRGGLPPNPNSQPPPPRWGRGA